MDRAMTINEPNLRAHVENLALTPRVPGSREHSDACGYIESQLRLFGYEPHRVPGARDGGVNVHANLGNQHKPLFIVGAHYDTVVGSPGADDNASGVAALLEVARAYSRMTPRMCVEFVAYDLEESGLLGSHEHCGQLLRDKADVVGMLSLEMLGFTGEDQVFVPGVETSRTRGDFLAVVANEMSAHLLKMFDGLETIASDRAGGRARGHGVGRAFPALRPWLVLGERLPGPPRDGHRAPAEPALPPRDRPAGHARLRVPQAVGRRRVAGAPPFHDVGLSKSPGRRLDRSCRGGTVKSPSTAVGFVKNGQTLRALRGAPRSSCRFRRSRWDRGTDPSPRGSSRSSRRRGPGSLRRSRRAPRPRSICP
jgi:hypothetical protein